MHRHFLTIDIYSAYKHLDHKILHFTFIKIRNNKMSISARIGPLCLNANIRAIFQNHQMLRQNQEVKL